MQTRTRRRALFLVGFVAYFGTLWALWDTIAVYPLKIFVVFLHELSHALAVWGSGGTVAGIVLDPYQGGATYYLGGSPFLALSAGYLGSLAWGGMLVTASRARRARPAFIAAGLGVMVLEVTALYVRSLFGVLFGILFGAAVLMAAGRLPVLWNRRLLLVLGLTSCLYAVLDIKSDILDRPELRSDAAMLGELTGVPTLVWGFAWAVTALLASALLFRQAWREA